MSRQQHIDQLERQRVAMTRDVEKIARDARSARGDLTTSAKHTAAALRDDAKGAVRQMSDDVRQVAAEAGSDTTSLARQRLVSGARATAQAADPRRFVRERPVAGLVVGLGLGLAASYLLGSRRRTVASGLAGAAS
jgi:ElaB/YqjD/DUF883 family membrane-anchored ribosome-binding protein